MPTNRKRKLEAEEEINDARGTETETETGDASSLDCKVKDSNIHISTSSASSQEPAGGSLARESQEEPGSGKNRSGDGTELTPSAPVFTDEDQRELEELQVSIAAQEEEIRQLEEQLEDLTAQLTGDEEESKRLAGAALDRINQRLSDTNACIMLNKSRRSAKYLGLYVSRSSSSTWASIGLDLVECFTRDMKHANSNDRNGKKAEDVIKGHIELLHKYNEIKDIGMGLLGMIAEREGVRVKDIMDEYEVDEKD